MISALLAWSWLCRCLVARSSGAADRSRRLRPYERRRPEETSLYPIVAQHLDSFLDEARDRHNGRGLPRYVERELRAYLKCGILAHGFARARCRQCSKELVVAFSCKTRSCCPSCAARRMTNTAAHLVDRVVPDVPVRQWVLSFPFELGMLLASRADALTYFNRVFVQKAFRWQRQRLDVTNAALAQGGAVAFHHRFGGSLNLHVHFHVCVLDGLYLREEETGELAFHPTPAPNAMDLQEILLCVHLRVRRWLKRRGLIRDPASDSDDSADTDEEPKPPTALQACMMGSLGVGQLVAPPDEPIAAVASPRSNRKGAGGESQFRDAMGYSTHAGVVVHAGNIAGRERLFRYCSRPPLSLQRLSVNDDWQVLYRVKGPRRGKTLRVMSPTLFLARLAALIPPPRHPLIRFHGVLAPHSALRKQVVPAATATDPQPDCPETSAASPKTSLGAPQLTAEQAQFLVTIQSSKSTHQELAPRVSPPPWRLDWATLLRRVYDVDVLQCPCGGRLSFVEVISAPQSAEAATQLDESLNTHFDGRASSVAPPVLDG